MNQFVTVNNNNSPISSLHNIIAYIRTHSYYHKIKGYIRSANTMQNEVDYSSLNKDNYYTSYINWDFATSFISHWYDCYYMDYAIICPKPEFLVIKQKLQQMLYILETHAITKPKKVYFRSGIVKGNLIRIDFIFTTHSTPLLFCIPDYCTIIGKFESNYFKNFKIFDENVNLSDLQNIFNNLALSYQKKFKYNSDNPAITPLSPGLLLLNFKNSCSIDPIEIQDYIKTMPKTMKYLANLI